MGSDGLDRLELADCKINVGYNWRVQEIKWPRLIAAIPFGHEGLRKIMMSTIRDPWCSH